MKPTFNDWTLVVVGSWNTAILNPEWLSQKVFDGNPIEIEVQMEPGRVLVQYVARKLRIIPQQARLVIACQDETALPAAEAALLRILQELPVTPIASTGINFGFEEHNPSGHLLDTFALADTDSLSDQGIVINETVVNRRLVIGGDILNLRLTLTSNAHVHFHCNFHSDTPGSEQAIEVVRNKVANRLTSATQLLSVLYNVELEEEV